MPLDEVVTACARTAVESLGFEVVQLRVDGRRHVRVVIDREPDGVRVDDCAAVNRAAKRAIAERGLDPGEFMIEVLSPGLDRPLTRAKDFVRFTGSTVTVRLARKRGDRRNWKGRLVSFVDDRISLREDGAASDETFSLDEIEEARLVPDLAPGGRRPEAR